jgi:hypothetical protein
MTTLADAMVEAQKALTETSASWLPEPLHEMAYSDMTRNTVIAFLRKAVELGPSEEEVEAVARKIAKSGCPHCEMTDWCVGKAGCVCTEYARAAIAADRAWLVKEIEGTENGSGT